MIILVYLIVTNEIQKEQAKASRIQEEIDIKNKRDNMPYLEIIKEIAPKFNQNPNELSLIVWNESQFTIKEHDGGRAKNITGTQNRTFKDWLPEYEREIHETLNIDSQYDQVKMMAWAFSKNRKVAWTTWVACQSPDKTYSFHSYQLDGDYTVVCYPLPKKYSVI